MVFQESTRKVLAYHEQTKHHLHRYARSPGYMDWANQPEPFRRFSGAPKIILNHPDNRDAPAYDSIFDPQSLPVQTLNRDTISRLFYDSLALSAWKQAPGTQPWPLRVNPSSGNLHPTEAYLICGPLPDELEEPAVFHYSPLGHHLEKRVDLRQEEWDRMVIGCNRDTLLVAFTSIYWREAWKYGERAFRYCNHDIGHALGAVALAAASLGWCSRLVESVSDQDLTCLLSLEGQEPGESEHPDCLLVISPTSSTLRLSIEQEMLQRLSGTRFFGQPNRLSQKHRLWTAIEHVSEATEYPGEKQTITSRSPVFPRQVSSSTQPARSLFRQRRSAVAMDSSGSISRQVFFRLLNRLAVAHEAVPFSLLPWDPLVSLLFFVHRVEDLAAGMYLLVRNPSHLSSLRAGLRHDFLWQSPRGIPEKVQFYLLEKGDFRDASKIISCHQNIASDGTFSLGMIARFEPVLTKFGPWYYRRIHWECGLIGQMLYLEAEAAEMSGTGIGCFHDDLFHELIGIEDHSWQTIYHFTVGKALEDSRLKTIPAYHHLNRVDPQPLRAPGSDPLEDLGE